MCAVDTIDVDGDSVDGARSVGNDDDGNKHIDTVDVNGESVGGVGTAIDIIVIDYDSIEGVRRALTLNYFLCPRFAHVLSSLDRDKIRACNWERVRSS